VRLPSIAPEASACSASEGTIGTPAAPRRSIASVCMGEAKMRIFMPLKSATVRTGLRVA